MNIFHEYFRPSITVQNTHINIHESGEMGPSTGYRDEEQASNIPHEYFS